MGTRGLLGHIIRGRKRACYNHFDSYPSGLGVDIVKFIKSLTDEQIKQLKQNLEKIEWVHEFKEDDKPSKELQQRYQAAGFADLSVNEKSPTTWYCLLRKVQGADQLPRILDGTLSHLVDGTSFEEDTTFCEWLYYIDWDAKELFVKPGGGQERKISFKDLSVEWMESQGTREDDDDASSDLEESRGGYP